MMTVDYLMIENVIPKEVCDIIIKRGMDLPQTDSDWFYTSDNVSTDKVSFIEDGWIFGLIRYHVDVANLRAFNLDINHEFEEDVQFTVYGEKGFFGWHTDTLPPEPSPIWPRKLSSVLMLSNPKDFEGGEFEIYDRSNESGQIMGKEISNFEQGSMIVFPSTTYHRVKPILSGKRITLVHWTHGPKLK